jgi:hypothetical protein
MANNTVNDVMNVITSPDYGIKKIASTYQEILAILQGTHNSQKNIHNIVDDVGNLLQTLIDNESKKKPVEVGANYAKINSKNIEKILDETKGIRKAIDKLATEIGKQSKANMPSVAKLGDDASERVADAMIKNFEKQNKGGGMSALVDAFNKLRDISIKDLIFGKLKINKITEMFKDAKDILKIDEKDLKPIIKLINATPEMINSLSKVSRKINKLIKNDTIKKLGDILTGAKSISEIASSLKKNEKLFENASEVIKDVKELTKILNKVMRKLFFASLWAKLASGGVKNLNSVIDELTPLSNKIVENKKNIKESVKISKKITPLVGHLLLSSILLTFAAVTGGPAILGAKLLSKMVNNLIPGVQSLSKNKKHIKESITASLMLVAVTGLMTISCVLLAAMAFIGIPALLGSMLFAEVVNNLIPAVKKLSTNKKHINGAIVPALMLVTLTGIMMVASVFLAAMSIFALPAMLGALALSVIVDLAMPAAKSLSKNKKHIANAIVPAIMFIAFTGIMLISSVLLAAMAVTGLPALIGSTLMLGVVYINVMTFKILKKALKNIIMGAISMVIMSGALFVFSLALDKIANATKGVDFKQVGIIASLTVILSGAIIALGIPALFPFILLGSVAIGIMGVALMPFAKVIKTLSEAAQNLEMKTFAIIAGGMTTLALGISALGFLIVPVLLGNITLLTMLNPLEKFSNLLKKISEATQNLEMKHITLTAKSMLTMALGISSLSFLLIPVILGNLTINAMIPPMRKFVDIVKTVSEIEGNPLTKVKQVLSCMRAITRFYQTQSLGFFAAIKAARNASRIKGYISNFAHAVKALEPLKDMQEVNAKAIHTVVAAVSDITWFFAFVKISGDIGAKSEFTRDVVEKFTTMALDIQDKFNGIREIDHKAVDSITDTCRSIIYYYTFTLFILKRQKVLDMNDCVQLFTNNAKYLKTISQGFTESDYKSVKLMVKSMKHIMTFLKRNTLNPIQRMRARKSISIFSRMAIAMKNLLNINTSNISSIGDSLTDALSGVNTINMDQVMAVTNMFNAFNGINKSENIINKFTESVKEFTSVCQNLMDAMDHNTDAINNIDSSSVGSTQTNIIRENNIIDGGTSGGNAQSGSIRIANVEEIAKTIADKINGALSVDMADTQIQLLINGSGGNEWTITRY